MQMKELLFVLYKSEMNIATYRKFNLHQIRTQYIYR